MGDAKKEWAYLVGHHDGYIGLKYKEPSDSPDSYKQGYVDGSRDFHESRSVYKITRDIIFTNRRN